MTTATRPLVTLIVPTRNEVAHIDACLESIAAQTYPTDRIECLVVDGESDDGTLDRVEAWARRDPRIRLLVNTRRTMPHGLNLGIDAARGEFVGVVSGHSVLPGGYVERAVEAIVGTGAWSVGGRIVRIWTTPLQHAIAVATASPIGVGDSRHNFATTAGWVETAFPGFWRRELFDQVGGFDPEMTVNEDNELSQRIRKAGGGIWYEPAIEVEYTPRSSLGALFRQYHGYARGRIRVARKHRGGLRWRHVVPAAWIAVLGSGPLLVVVGGPVAAAWGVVVVLYGAAVMVGAAWLGRRGPPRWLIAASLVTLHLAYGTGIWHGLVDWATARSLSATRG